MGVSDTGSALGACFLEVALGLADAGFFWGKAVGETSVAVGCSLSAGASLFMVVAIQNRLDLPGPNYRNSPVFTKSRTRLYVPGFVEPDQDNFDFNVVNNRVVAHHVGIEGYLRQAQYKLLSTFTRNYGTYGGLNNGIRYWGSIENPDAEYAFKPAQRQAYFLLEVASHPFSQQWSLLTSMAWDVGQLTNNVGILIGLRREGILTLGRKE